MAISDNQRDDNADTRQKNQPDSVISNAVWYQVPTYGGKDKHLGLPAYVGYSESTVVDEHSVALLARPDPTLRAALESQSLSSLPPQGSIRILPRPSPEPLAPQRGCSAVQ